MTIDTDSTAFVPAPKLARLPERRPLANPRRLRRGAHWALAAKQPPHSDPPLVARETATPSAWLARQFCVPTDPPPA